MVELEVEFLELVDLGFVELDSVLESYDILLEQGYGGLEWIWVGCLMLFGLGLFIWGWFWFGFLLGKGFRLFHIMFYC